jgi:ATP-dependent HslUV protease subunit HslV
MLARLQSRAPALLASCQRAALDAAAGAGAPPPAAAAALPAAARALASRASRHFSAGAGATRSTTVLCVRKDGEVVLVADGQVTMGATVVKPNVVKTRRIGDTAIGGFAGATADAFTLFERLETRLEEHSGQLTRAAVELAKMWRMDKYLRRLDAALIIADARGSLQITGTGDVLEPHDGIIAIGSGSPYALAAARALVGIEGLDAAEVARRAMNIAAEACVYTNHNFSALRIGRDGVIADLDLRTPPAGGGGGGSGGDGGGSGSEAAGGEALGAAAADADAP